MHPFTYLIRPYLKDLNGVDFLLRNITSCHCLFPFPFYHSFYSIQLQHRKKKPY